MPVLYLTEQGAVVRKEGEVLVVEKDGEVLEKVPAIKVEQVVVLGNISLTTPVIHYFLRQGIDCVFCSSFGRYHGRLVSNESTLGVLRRQQAAASLREDFCLKVGRSFVTGKVHNQRVLLQRARRYHGPQQALDGAIEDLKAVLDRLEKATRIPEVRGLEGYASALYYHSLRYLFREDWGFRSRVKRPPTDPVNSLLSFGYTLLVYNVQAAVSTVGLDPFMGFFHTPEYTRPSLVLDLMEEFRPIVVDSVVLDTVNHGAITRADFQMPAEEGEMVALTQQGIKKFLYQYEQRVQTKVFHPLAGGQVTYRRCFELQARQLAQVIEGKKEDYTPFGVR